MMNDFSNDAINIEELPTWENIYFTPISPKYKRVIFFNIVLSWIILIGIAVFILLVNNVTSVLTFSFVGGAITLLVLFFLIFDLISLSRRGYALREQDVLYKAGIFSHYTLVIPFKHIQHVKINEGVISRMLGLVSIEIFTAGAGRDMRIAGLDKENALRLQQHISGRITGKEKEETTGE